jgi:hypothetical protein
VKPSEGGSLKNCGNGNELNWSNADVATFN